MPTKSRSIHGSLCPWWLGPLLDNPVRALIQPPARIVAGHIRPGQRVADLGAGPGFFTFAMAQCVGPSGRVYAVDVQPSMLAQIDRKARRRRIDHVVTCLVRDGFTLPEHVDFVLMFWMLHEVTQRAALLAAVHAALNDGGTILFVEPKLHVSLSLFQREQALFAAAGFRVRAPLTIPLSRALLWEKA